MNLTNSSIKVIEANTAAEFWDLLSPECPLFQKPCNLLYRGQADHTWRLTPYVLRKEVSGKSDDQVVKEWAYIDQFVKHCDAIGLPIPNDSLEFREKYLNQNSPAGPGGSCINTSAWLHPEMYPLLALGQHYNLPTRLLDWSTRSYVAAYFAISDALKMVDNSPEKLAVWVLNTEHKALFPELKVVKVPGSNNMNLAAQAGQFTLLEQEGYRGQPFSGEKSLDLYLQSKLPSSLKKVTLPITEASDALKLCSLYGVTGAILFPSYSGAVRATIDTRNMKTSLCL
jgi:hypothetical protein